MLAQLKKEYEKQGVYFLSLTIETEDSANKVAGWLKTSKAEGLTAARSSASASQRLHQMAGLPGVAIPSVILIDETGVVVKGLEAPFTHEELTEAVKALASE